MSNGMLYSAHLKDCLLQQKSSSNCVITDFKMIMIYSILEVNKPI